MADDARRLEVLTRVGRALVDPTRCRILLALVAEPGYPAQLAASLGLSRATVSNHLSCLRGCGLVTATRRGRQVRYALSDPTLAHALSDLASLVPAAGCGHDPVATDLDRTAASGARRAG